VEFTQDEIEFLKAMADYLQKRNFIKEATVEETIKYAVLSVLGPLVLKEIEERRV